VHKSNRLWNLPKVIHATRNILYHGFFIQRLSNLVVTKSILFILAISAFSLSTVVSAAEPKDDRAQDFFQRGEKAYFLEKYTEAVDWYERAAELGNLEAKRSLALMYATGHGVDKDPERADKLYRSMMPKLRAAAENGDVAAMRTMAYMLENGHGIPKRPGTAVSWYVQAAKLGDVSSMRTLSTIYDLGVYVPRDIKRSIHWLTQAAEQGHASSMYELAQRYETGNGVEKDSNRAVQWYQTAASFGERAAQNELRRLGQQRGDALKLYSASGDKQYTFIRYQGARVDMGCFTLKENCIAMRAMHSARAGKIKKTSSSRGSPMYLMCSTAGGRWEILRDARRTEYFLCRFVDNTMVEAKDLYTAAKFSGR
jgi:TPR repeat protein